MLIDPGSSGNTDVDNAMPSSGGTTTSTTTTTTHSTTGTPIPATFNIASNSTSSSTRGAVQPGGTQPTAAPTMSDKIAHDAFVRRPDAIGNYKVVRGPTQSTANPLQCGTTSSITTSQFRPQSGNAPVQL